MSLSSWEIDSLVDFHQSISLTISIFSSIYNTLQLTTIEYNTIPLGVKVVLNSIFSTNTAGFIYLQTGYWYITSCLYHVHILMVAQVTKPLDQGT